MLLEFSSKPNPKNLTSNFEILRSVGLQWQLSKCNEIFLGEVKLSVDVLYCCCSEKFCTRGCIV